MREIRAQLNFLRMSPRKVRLVADLIRGFPVAEAQRRLQFITRGPRLPLQKLLKSAITNAVHNFGAKEYDLYIQRIQVNQGPVLKRWTPKAFGRAAPIRKPSCHITLVLGTTTGVALSPHKVALSKPQMVEELVATTKEKKGEAQAHVGDRVPIAKKKSGFLRKIFQRKAI